MGYDLNALQSLKEKEEILSQAHQQDWILFFEHDPNCDAARIQKTDKDDYKVRETFYL